MQTLDKKVTRAFGKEIVLIGQDGGKVNYWLEYPKWDCGWYWGFGYVETYTNNNNPGEARDINSHTHFSGYVGAQEKYDFDKKAFVKADYIPNVADNKHFTAMTIDNKTGWELSELFGRFYLLKQMAEYYKQGGVHLTTIGTSLGIKVANDSVKNLNRWKEINTLEIPPVMEAIIKILHPNPDSVKIEIPDIKG